MMMIVGYFSKYVKLKYYHVSYIWYAQSIFWYAHSQEKGLLFIVFLLSSYLHPILLFNTHFYYLHFVLKHLKVSGLSKWFATKLALMDDLEAWVLNLVLCLITSGLTEFISNPAVNNLMMPILSSLVRTPHVYL